MTLHDGIAYLDMLAAQLHARGWTAYISMPAGRVAALSVQDPDDRAQWSDVIAAPGGATGDWWYWFSWAERIGPIQAPAAAAEVIIRALQQPMDGAVLAGIRGRARGRQKRMKPDHRRAELTLTRATSGSLTRQREAHRITDSPACRSSYT